METTTEYFSKKGMSYCLDGNFEEGLKLFNRGLDFDENSILLLYNKAGCLKSLNRDNEAKILLNKVISLCDSQEKTEQNLKLKSNALVLLKNFDEAIDVLEEILEKTPNDIDSLMNMAICYDHHFNNKKTLEYLDRILKIDPSDLHALLMKSEVLMHMNKLDESKEYMDMAFEINPSDAHVWYLKGQYESKLSNYESALKYYEKALDIEPNASKYIFDAGICMILLGKIDEAKSTLKRIFDLNPEDYDPERYEYIDEICEILRNTFPSSKGDN